MQSVGEWMVGLSLMVIIGLVIVAVAKQFLGRSTSEYEAAARHLHRPSLRRAVIRLAELLAIVQVILLTVGGAIGGGFYARIIAGMVGNPQVQQRAAVTGAFLGGGAGFLSAMVITGLLFTLAAIEENTRTTASMLALVAKPRQAPAPEY
jgi:hypothetical protein